MEQNQNLDVNKRIEQILHNEHFRAECAKHRERNPFFNYLPLIEQLARIDINNIPVNSNLFKMDVTHEDVVNEIYSFYGTLDSICHGYPLLDKAKQNLQYLTHTPNYSRLKPGEKPRSACGTEVMPDGSIKRDIFIDLEQDIRTLFTGDHEVGHSLSKTFKIGERHKDPLMAELCPVIIDTIALNIYVKNNPDKLPVINELKKFHIINNVKKARQSVLESCVVDVMLGNTTLNEVMQKYGSMFDNSMVLNCIESIEQGRFKPMFESKYVFSQVIATALDTKMQTNPNEVVTDFKNVLSVDNQITFSQATDMLHLPPKEVMVSHYQSKFNELSKTK